MWYYGICGNLNPFLMCSGLSKKKQATFKNNLEFQNHFMKWLNIAINRYEYEGLPESIDQRIIEMSFILRGMAMVAEIDGSYYALFPAPGYDMNLNAVPTKAYGYGYNGFNKLFQLFVRGADDGPFLLDTINGKASKLYNAVMGFDNKARYPYVNYLATGCSRMADIKRSEDVIRANMKRPAIVLCEESQIQSVKQSFNSLDNNENVIAISAAGLDPRSVNVWDLKTEPGILKELADAYSREENQMRDVFGLNSLPNQDKRERLITDEANANNELTQSSADIGLVMREQFCEDLYTAFGIPCSVKLRVEPVKEVDEDVDKSEDDDVSGMEEG